MSAPQQEPGAASAFALGIDADGFNSKAKDVFGSLDRMFASGSTGLVNPLQNTGAAGFQAPDLNAGVLWQVGVDFWLTFWPQIG